MLELGIKGKQLVKVDETNVASSYGSGTLPVFATPAMIAYMEYTAQTSVQPYLDEGKSTVGTKVNIEHVSATPIGMTVRVESELIEINGKRLKFKVEAYDDEGIIGSGTHERAIVTAASFVKRTEEKAQRVKIANNG